MRRLIGVGALAFVAAVAVASASGRGAPTPAIALAYERESLPDPSQLYRMVRRADVEACSTPEEAPIAGRRPSVQQRPAPTITAQSAEPPDPG